MGNETYPDADKILGQVGRLLKTEDRNVPYRLVRRLKKLDDPRATDLLLEMTSGGPSDCGEVLEALQTKQDDRIVPTAKELLASYPEDSCVPPIDLAMLLGHQGDALGPATLISVLEDWYWSLAALGKLEKLMREIPECFEDRQLEQLAELPELDICALIDSSRGFYPDPMDPVETRELARKVLEGRVGTG